MSFKQPTCEAPSAKLAEVAAGVRYRDAVRSDLTRLVELDSICFPPDTAYPRDVMRYYVSHPRGRTIVAESVQAGAAIIGFIVMRAGRGKVAEIVTIDVDPSSRRMGIATSLMRLAEEWAVSEKARVLALEVDQENSSAVALYDNLGFTIAERYLEQSKPRFVMVKSLLAP